MDKFNEIKKRFRKRGKQCGHVGGKHETYHGLVLSCCSNFKPSCTPRAFDDLERVIIELCHECDRLKSQLALVQVQPATVNNYVQNNTIYVQNNTIGVRGDDILRVVRKCIEGGGDRNNMYAAFANLIANAPQSENRDRTLALIRSNNDVLSVDAEMRIHSAFMDAIDEVKPEDADELDAFMDKDYSIIECNCKTLGIEIVEDIPSVQPNDIKKRKIVDVD